MQIGVTFPQLESGSDPGAIREYAEAVEGLGYRHLVAFDHVLGADRDREDPRMQTWPKAAYSHRDQFHEPFALFGFLAAVTHSLELATGILILPQRQTALVAKQAAEIDLLSGGRLRLGVGLGWNHLEYEALGVPWERRGKRMTEQMQLLRQLWTSPVVDFEGEFHSIPRVGINPLPTHSIPIWTGAGSPAALRRAGRHADGVMAALGGAHPDVESWAQAVREALAEVGRDPSTFAIEGRVDLYGRTPDEIAADVERWRALGATHLSVNTMAPPKLRDKPSRLDVHIEMIGGFVEIAGGFAEVAGR